MTSGKIVIVLGDQLDHNNPALIAEYDAPVLMVESVDESKVVWSHKARTILFLSAMRHFASELRQAGREVHYSTLHETGQSGLVERLVAMAGSVGATELIVSEPGEWRIEQSLIEASKRAGLKLRLLSDSHFLCSRDEFSKWAAKYKQMRMEYFYRDMRKRYQVLMDGGEPCQGRWNFDTDNRGAFPKQGPGSISEPASFQPDEITKQVIQEVSALLPENPGSVENFSWPVTRMQALKALDVFIETRLQNFGQYQDAMWTNTPFGWHSLISSSINLHLLHPLEVIKRAELAYREGGADIAAVEGFIRQILGWREFIRGVYWLDMPAMRRANFLDASLPLPEWFWTGKTSMACLSDSIGQTLRFGYAHHIQRLMVIGNFALLAGLSPQAVEDWFLAVYVDAVEWVELPNVAGMALFANGGRFTSKPYVASGAYIKRMSNYCKGCKYDPSVKVGDKACPMTTLYWGFLDKHENMLKANPRTALMAKNIGRLDSEQRDVLRNQVSLLLENISKL